MNKLFLTIYNNFLFLLSHITTTQVYIYIYLFQYLNKLNFRFALFYFLFYNFSKTISVKCLVRQCLYER